MSSFRFAAPPTLVFRVRVVPAVLAIVYPMMGHPARKAGAELHGRLDPRRVTKGPAGASVGWMFFRHPARKAGGELHGRVSSRRFTNWHVSGPGPGWAAAVAVGRAPLAFVHLLILSLFNY